MAYQFSVVNITNDPLAGHVTWTGGDRSESIDVAGLAPGSISSPQNFSPQSGVKDEWQWSERGRQYQLNCYDDDHHALVVISNYGIAVLVTATAPDTWKW